MNLILLMFFTPSTVMYSLLHTTNNLIQINILTDFVTYINKTKPNMYQTYKRVLTIDSWMLLNKVCYDAVTDVQHEAINSLLVTSSDWSTRSKQTRFKKNSI